MLNLLILAAGLLVLGVTAALAIVRPLLADPDGRGPGRRHLGAAVAGGTAGAVLLVVGISAPLVEVPAGSVGVVMTWGQVQEGTLEPGLRVVVPVMQHVALVDTRVQPHTFNEIEAASAEYQAVRLSGTMNYHVDGRYASDLYQRVGTDFASKVLDPAFSDFIKTVVPQYAIGEILGKRDEIRAKAKAALQENLAQYHVVVDDIYLSQVGFSAEYNAAIEAKQVAAQQVETEKQVLAQKQIQAQQRVADAQGQADAEVALAKGQAEANRRIGESLSPEVLQYLAVQKLADKVDVMLVPSGQGYLFDLKGMLGQAPQQAQ